MASMPPAKTIGSREIKEAIEKMAGAIAEKHHGTEKLGILGLADGGIILSRRLAAAVSSILGREIPCGVIDISFHRDDISTKPIPKTSIPTTIPFDIENATVILADDVLSTGRSLRAAINEIFDQGRPACLQAAALFDRGGRLLPFQADFAGFVEDVSESRKVYVRLSEDAAKEDEIRIAEASNDQP